MSAHTFPCRCCPGPPDTLDLEFRDRALVEGVVKGGHHNRNYMLPLRGALALRLGCEPGTRAIVRVAVPGAPAVVIRTWPPSQEGHLVRAVRDAVPWAPECLAQYDDFAIHSHVAGVPLSLRCEDGKPVDEWAIRGLVELLARMHRVKAPGLPSLAPGWPVDGCGRDFLRALAHAVDQQIVRPNRTEFQRLFEVLGVPQDAMARLAGRASHMASRPFGLLHTDLHRGNVLQADDGEPLLTPLDLELASYGDPLYDLATHLERMKYPHHQREQVIAAWAEAMADHCPGATRNLERDLRHYVAFERAQSVYPDVVRAALALRKAGGATMAAATQQVCRAVTVAQEPLGLARVPGPGEVEGALTEWMSTPRPSAPGARIRSGSRPRRAPGKPRGMPRAESAGGIHMPDPRRRERVFLGDRALLRAIEALREAAADRLPELPYAGRVRHLGDVGVRLGRRVLSRVVAAWRACVDGLGRLAAGVRLAVRNVRRAARFAWEATRESGGERLGVAGA
ncbi:phosphotransferase family protein [Streptomyces sp. WAC 04229]|uniref:phosphotransferase family protein n=1 Tax=Streptomyces sp. WAC 04229 TaxID=2203206 RepID=UPI003D75E19F